MDYISETSKILADYLYSTWFSFLPMYILYQSLLHYNVFDIQYSSTHLSLNM